MKSFLSLVLLGILLAQINVAAEMQDDSGVSLSPEVEQDETVLEFGGYYAEEEPEILEPIRATQPQSQPIAAAPYVYNQCFASGQGCSNPYNTRWFWSSSSGCYSNPRSCSFDGYTSKSSCQANCE